MPKVVYPSRWQKKHTRNKGYQQQMRRYRARHKRLAELVEQTDKALSEGRYQSALELARQQEALATQEELPGVRKANRDIIAAMEGQKRQAEDARTVAAASAAHLQQTMDTLTGDLAQLQDARKHLDQIDNEELEKMVNDLLTVALDPGVAELYSKLQELLNPT